MKRLETAAKEIATILNCRISNEYTHLNDSVIPVIVDGNKITIKHLHDSEVKMYVDMHFSSQKRNSDMYIKQIEFDVYEVRSLKIKY